MPYSSADLGTFERRIAAGLAHLDEAGLSRRAPPISEREGVRYRLDGRPVVGLCSNDYLDLADARLPATGVAGAGGSRLVCGDLAEHRALERSLAAIAGTDDAVLFPSGYQLNVGVLPALVERRDIVASDALNHASLIDGLRLARASIRVLAHRTAPDDLALPEADATLWWITESTFSMDGDLVDLDALRRHLARGGALYVDEAHAIGLHQGGQGLLARHGIVPTVVVAPLGKAFGCAGAFVGASAPVCAWIRSRARSFVFSTGTSPTVVAQLAAAVDRVRGDDGDLRRARLWRAAHHLARRLGLDHAPSPIFPIVIGDNHAALSIAGALFERGWHVQPIRPPTVPVGTARLRVTVGAGHDIATINAFADALIELLDRASLPLVVDRGAGFRAIP